MSTGDEGNVFPGPCAACKFHRKRCEEGCQLARYFPASKYEDFLNVHRLYGVSNFLKILNVVPGDKKDKTAETLIFEARIRKDFPVHGSIAIESSLRAQIGACESELDFVNKQLALHRQASKKKMNQQAGGKVVLPPDPLPPQGPHLQFPSSEFQFPTSLGGYYDQALATIGPPSDANTKPFDIQPVSEHSLPNIAGGGESSSGSKARGKKPIIYK